MHASLPSWRHERTFYSSSIFSAPTNYLQNMTIEAIVGENPISVQLILVVSSVRPGRWSIDSIQVLENA